MSHACHCSIPMSGKCLKTFTIKGFANMSYLKDLGIINRESKSSTYKVFEQAIPKPVFEEIQSEKHSPDIRVGLVIPFSKDQGRF